MLVADRDVETGQAVVQALKAQGARAAFQRFEAGKEEECLRLADTALSRFGEIHTLVNVAGARVYGPVHTADEASWDHILGVNLKGVAFCSKGVLPHMMERKRGTIVHISSANAEIGRGGMAQYDASKAGVLALTRAMAHDYAPYGIRVNAVLPGPTITQFHLKRAAERGVTEAEIRAQGAPHTLLKRQAEPREIAYGVLFLACDESSYVTGTSLFVDGGYNAT